ncbi:pre-rRNA processing and 40S ribosomal subunit assembly [Sporothrix curviconia]|uniref:Pre-rRNA processing and 40S ribosomal subunit assembly n=1 Tax=Sporothrix curviconia TaxID=1260050 RepID=A0ABP0CU35_9PEZI
MATVLGKRKKAAADTANDSDVIQDIFRRHFEAQFKPLAVEAKKIKKADTKSKAQGAGTGGKKMQRGAAVVIRENESDDNEDEDDESDFDDGGDDSDDSDESGDWSGLSGDDEAEDEPKNAAPAIEVVDYSTDPTKETPETAMSKQERKLYLSKRPPTSFDEEANRAAAANSKKNKKKKDGTAAAADSTFKDAPELLANDLELQRLISESHLLAGAFRLPSSFSTASGATSTVGSASDITGAAGRKSSQPFAAGRLRQRTIDLRVQAVANKARGDASSSSAGTVTVSQASESIFTPANLPMSIRKGMAAAAALRETKRRREARESGIVLERPAAKLVSKSAAKRMRAVDAPAVGRMRGSELRLRDKDVREIEGPRKGAFSKKKKKRR